MTNFGKDMTDKIKKNACKNAYLGSIFIPEKYVFRVCSESPFTRMISNLKYKWPPRDFSGMKIDPKYAFLIAFFFFFFFFLMCQVLSKICQYDQKHTLFPFFFLRFCTPKRCTRLHCYGPEKQLTLITEFLLRG